MIPDCISIHEHTETQNSYICLMLKKISRSDDECERNKLIWGPYLFIQEFVTKSYAKLT